MLKHSDPVFRDSSGYSLKYKSFFIGEACGLVHRAGYDVSCDSSSFRKGR